KEGEGRHLLVKDNAGAVLFDGPIEADVAKVQLSPEIRGKLFLMVRGVDAKAAPAPMGKEALEQVLDEFNVQEVPLREALEMIRERTGANLVVNWKALAKAGVEPNEPVTLRLRSVSLSTLLSTLLSVVEGDKGQLGCTVKDEVLLISTVGHAAPPAK